MSEDNQQKKGRKKNVSIFTILVFIFASVTKTLRNEMKLYKKGSYSNNYNLLWWGW